MKLEQQCVSLELAQKLKELGVKQESYFGWVDDPMSRLGYFVTNDSKEWDYEYSAFTVAELGEMMKEPIKDFPYGSHKNIYQVSSGYENEGINKNTWECRVIERNIGTQFIKTADTEADARAKMLVYLIENKLINLVK